MRLFFGAGLVEPLANRERHGFKKAVDGERRSFHVCTLLTP
jgi:hypothetical protein